VPRLVEFERAIQLGGASMWLLDRQRLGQLTCRVAGRNLTWEDSSY